MKNYMPQYRECEKMRIDFSSEKADGNTQIVKDHAIGQEFEQRYKQCKATILKSRKMLSAPNGFHTGSMNTAAAFYKLTLSNVLHTSLRKLSLENDSWETIPGLSKKTLKRKNFDPAKKAATVLAELVWLKRQQCITALKIQQNRLSSFTESITSKMLIQEKELDQKVALLGLQGHQKTSEPFHRNVSYIDGIQYDFAAEVGKYEEAKSNNKAESHLAFKCNKGCILPNEEDLTHLRDLFDESARLGDMEPHKFREFLGKYQECTNYHNYSEQEKKDLNPTRMYLFPVKQRSHPEQCYIPQQSENAPAQHQKCESQEVTIRKCMVHYANPRKFHSIMSKAITAHKVMCDIDAASVVGDAEYLAKLVKVKLTYDDSTVGFNSQSEAREWTTKSIESKLAEVAVQGKTARTTFSHRDIYDRERFNLPSVRCYCCDMLATPKQSSTLDLNTAKKLMYDPENDIHPHPIFESFQNFLLEKGIISDNLGDCK